MKNNKVRQWSYALLIGAALLMSSSLVSQAQSPDRARDRRDNQQYPNQQYPNQRRDRDGDERNHNSPTTNRDQQKGYSDGVTRGQQDARSNRTPTPENSSHYRNGNNGYRVGFRRGYNESYRQYGRGGRH